MRPAVQKESRALILATLAALVLALPAPTPRQSTSQTAQAAQPSPLVEELWNAAREGDTTRVAMALDQGADVNAGNRYKATALFFAADKGHTDVIRLLLDRGADVNAQDTFYRFRPLGMALMNGHVDAALLVLRRGSLGAMQALSTGIQRKHTGLVEAALASAELTAANVRAAMTQAKRRGTPEIIAALEKKTASFPAEATRPPVFIDRATLQQYAGRYRNAKTGTRHYRARVGGGGSFSASPIAADGRLYFSSEDGDIIVVRAGPKYEELAKNPMGEVIMSTPAISAGTIIVRTLGHVYAVGR